jgi:glycosyltransferase involved in cell wall biosynthesis
MAAVRSEEKLVIVMPVRDEQDCIGKVARDWLEIVSRVPGARLVAIDDGSGDRTGTILDAIAAAEPRLVVEHRADAGYARAVMASYRAALRLGGHWIFHVDSDDQFAPSDFWKLWERRSASPYVTGFRSSRGDGIVRRAVSAGLALFDRILFGVSIRDANIPFRLIRAGLLEAVLAEVPAEVLFPNVFIAILAARAGADLCETPVAHRCRATGSSAYGAYGKLLKASLRSAFELWSFRRALGPAAERVKARV